MRSRAAAWIVIVTPTPAMSSNMGSCGGTRRFASRRTPLRSISAVPASHLGGGECAGAIFSFVPFIRRFPRWYFRSSCNTACIAWSEPESRPGAAGAGSWTPLPAADPARLVHVAVMERQGEGTSYPDYLDYRDQNRVLSGLAASGVFGTTVERPAAEHGGGAGDETVHAWLFEPKAAYQQVTDEVRTLPGVTSCSLIWGVPLSGVAHSIEEISEQR